jgi:hypothetical protein
VESYISEKSGIDFSKVFAQYLTTVNIPVLEYKTENGKTSFRWANVVKGFAMPVKANGQWLKPTEVWQTMPAVDSLTVDPNFFVTAKKVS